VSTSINSSSSSSNDNNGRVDDDFIFIATVNTQQARHCRADTAPSATLHRITVSPSARSDTKHGINAQLTPLRQS